jgi:hypothetical protein
MITLGAEMRSTIEEWFEEFRKAIDLANGDITVVSLKNDSPMS